MLSKHDQSRSGIDAPERLFIQTASVHGFAVGREPGFGDRPQSGVGRFHAAQPDLFEELDEGVRLRDDANRPLQCEFNAVHR